MFHKRAICAESIEPLNKIKPMFDLVKEDGKTVCSCTKTCETKIETKDFDLNKEMEEHSDSLFVQCFAIKADEPNDNGDYFSKDELIKATDSFVGVPLYTNHTNNDINQAKGKVVHSWWNEEKNGIMIIARLDAVAYPHLARGIREGYVAKTSMGCSVQHSLCSICHAYAEKPDDYCSHIKNQKTRTFYGSSKCAYKKSGPLDKCPICDCKKSEEKSLKYADGKKVYEYNYGIKFIENSFVSQPACHDCGITEVIDPKKLLKKVAEIEAALPKLLQSLQANQLKTNIKIAGQKELESLNQALDIIRTSIQSMLQQMEQLDMEFVSDLVKVLADLQQSIDELTQQGYGRLPSPGEAGVNNEQNNQPTITAPPQGDITHSVQPMNPTPGGGSKIVSGPAGNAGTVTGPLASEKIINLQKVAESILEKKINNLTMNKIALVENTGNMFLAIENNLLLKTRKKQKLDLQFSFSSEKNKG